MHWLVVLGLILPISLLHYLTPQFETLRHLVYRELYLLPIFLASFWYGLMGGVFSSLLVTAIYLPLIFNNEVQTEVHLLDNVIQVVVFNLFAVTLGYLRDRDFKRQKEQAKIASLAAMGQAVSSIAHDLKSPLMAIGGFVTQVRRKMNEQDPSAPKLDIAIAQAARMEAMVKDMLAFARPLELHLKKTDVNALIEQVVQVAQAAAAKDCHIVVELDPKTPNLNLDGDRMQQALLNLVNNGLEASPEDGSLRVVSRYFQNKLEIEVRDQGLGIAPGNQSQLFVPFATTKKGGTGLGLSISKKIVEAHGGSLRLKQTSPAGTSFTIHLSLASCRTGDDLFNPCSMKSPPV